jgi:DNA helicase HerA-like ATPase
MLLDLSERGRYLGLVLFSAQQFRSQVQRRVVGNAGTGIYGRMDMDELAVPAYTTLSAATKIKLATLPKGELMLRHPHFTQPIFVKFPRPAVLNSREGIERFPPAAELPFADAVARQMRALDRRVSADAVRTLIDGRREEDVRRALAATRRERPVDVYSFFTACLGRRVPGEVSAARRAVPALRRVDDTYGG